MDKPEVAYSVGDHCRKHRAILIVGIEFAHQDGNHGELDSEDDGMEERLESARIADQWKCTDMMIHSVDVTSCRIMTCLCNVHICHRCSGY